MKQKDKNSSKKKEILDGFLRVFKWIGWALLYAFVFITWLITACIELILRHLNKTMKQWLFPHRT
jgi:hypothetical protein